MASKNFTPKDQALAHLNDALNCGVRGANKDVIQNAIDTIMDDGRNGLTDLACKNLKHGQKPLKDTKCMGLRLQANKKNKVWIYRYSFEGKQPELNFGKYPAVSLARARELHEAALDALGEGRDPAGNSTGQMTVEDFCQRYLNLAEERKRSWRDDEQQIKKDILPAWKGKLANEITTKEASELVERAYARGAPRSAEKLVSLARFMFNVATGKGKGRKWLVDGNKTQVEPWFSIENPFDRIVLPEHTPKNCVLKGKTLKSYLQKFDTATFSDEVSNVLKLQLWCNTRISEPFDMAWEEVDLEDGIWTIPEERAKTGVELDVMLSTQAFKLLESLEPEDSGYVFAFEGLKRSSILGHLAKQIRNNRKHLGVPGNFSSHSLRHTGQTLLASMGCPVEVRDRISNHTPDKKNSMSARYNAHEYDQPAREWLQKLANQVDALSITNVVHMEKRDA